MDNNTLLQPLKKTKISPNIDKDVYKEEDRFIKAFNYTLDALGSIDIKDYELSVRKEQFEIIKSFYNKALLNSSKPKDKIIYLYGTSGSGKTFFMDYFLKNNVKIDYKKYNVPHHPDLKKDIEEYLEIIKSKSNVIILDEMNDMNMFKYLKSIVSKTKTIIIAIGNQLEKIPQNDFPTIRFEPFDSSNTHKIIWKRFESVKDINEVPIINEQFCKRPVSHYQNMKKGNIRDVLNSFIDLFNEFYKNDKEIKTRDNIEKFIKKKLKIYQNQYIESIEKLPIDQNIMLICLFEAFTNTTFKMETAYGKIKEKFNSMGIENKLNWTTFTSSFKALEENKFLEKNGKNKKKEYRIKHKIYSALLEMKKSKKN